MSGTIGSLFTGGGGWEVGARDLGLTPLFGVEMDAAVAAHYASVFGSHVRIGNAATVNYRTLPRVDVLVSSPPCQPTSNSGKQARALRASRGIHANDDFADPVVGLVTLAAVEALSPPVVFVENSVGYISTDVFARLRGGLTKLGYTTSVRVLDAADYGVASSRKRAILRALRSAVPVPWAALSPRVSWLDQIRDLIPSLPRAKLALWQAYALCDNPPPNATPILVAGGNPSRNGDGYIVHRTPDEPAWTTQKSKNTSGMRFRDAAGVVRALTPRAIARLQGFPDSYPLPEQRSLAIHILGNSIPPVFAKALLESVMPCVKAAQPF